TEPIAQAFARYATRPVVPRGGPGAAVRWVPCAESDAVAAADRQVQRLLEEGWAPEHVMLLNTGSRHPEHVSRLEHAGRAGYWDSFWDAGDVFYGHVLNTKGLERPAVVLAVNGFREAERELRYVGMSRARDLLVVCGPR
ncbi:MAG: ATP-binding domain-containing protein, partial [Actinomycetota bacterium]|nr:ATP-binding domain-containing protein [Actinomycetota bacterium]